VQQCEESCKQQIKEAVASERALLADAVQKQVSLLLCYTIFVHQQQTL